MPDPNPTRSVVEPTADPVRTHSIADPAATTGGGFDRHGPAVVFTRAYLGLALLGAGKPAEAEPHLLAGHAGLTKQKTPAAFVRKQLRLVTAGMVELYEQTGRPEQTADWRAKLAALPPEVAPPPREVKR